MSPENTAYVERILREIELEDLLDMHWTARGEDLIACVECSDWFWWGMADCEPVEADEIDDLVACCKDDQRGSIWWVSKKRNLRPQMPIWEDMSPERQAFYEAFDPPTTPKTMKAATVNQNAMAKSAIANLAKTAKVKP